MDDAPDSAGLAASVARLMARRADALARFVVGEATGVATSWELTRAVDSCLGEAIGPCPEPSTPCRWVLLAVGSYGRRELSFSSDVDCVLLHEGAEPRARVAALTALVQAMWNGGLRAAIAVYDLRRARELAHRDLRVFSALLDARRVEGNDSLSCVLGRVRFPAGRVRRFARFLAGEDDNRHLAANLDLFAAEPDLKLCVGGLRDLASIGWLRKIAPAALATLRSSRGRSRLREALGLSASSQDDLDAARETLLTARHRIGGQLSLRRDRVSREACARLEALEDGGAANVGRALRALGVARIRVSGVRRVLLDALSTDVPRPGAGLGPDLRVAGDRLYPADPAGVAANPDRLLAMVALAAGRGLSLAPATALHARLARVRPPARPTPARWREALASPGVSSLLEGLLEAGLLHDLLPGFHRTLGLVPGDEVHAYTVDRHSVLVAGALCAILDGDSAVPPGCDAALATPRADRVVMILAALLHDLGKAHGTPHDAAGADAARAAAAKLGLSDEDCDRVRLLCLRHMVLPVASLTRDCDDPTVIRSLSVDAGPVPSLDRLLVLALADQRSLGGTVPTAFHESLLVRAWRNTRAALVEGEGRIDASERLDARRGALRSRADGARLAPSTLGLIADLPARFLGAFDDDDVLRYLEVLERARIQSPCVAIRPIAGSLEYEVVYVGHDELGLLSRLAGALYLMSLPIQEARIFSLPDHAVLDVFRVTDPGDRWLSTRMDRCRAETRLAEAVRDLDVSARVRQRMGPLVRRTANGPGPAIVADVDNAASEHLTTFRVSGPDAPGLLHLVADALYRHGIDVVGALVTTVGGEARDTFFAQWGALGGKVTDAETIRRVLRTLSDL